MLDIYAGFEEMLPHGMAAVRTSPQEVQLRGDLLSKLLGEVLLIVYSLFLLDYNHPIIKTT